MLEVSRRSSRRFLIPTASLLAAVGALSGPIVADAASPATTKTVTFTTAGGHSFKVPSNVAFITVTAVGAAGGSCAPGGPFVAVGGQGASVRATVPVKPGSTLFVGVGGVGGACPLADLTGVGGGAGGAGGGGTGGGGTVGGGPGGGGASGVGYMSLGASGGALVVGAGGGGAGYCGAGGGNAGAPGQGGQGELCRSGSDPNYGGGGGAGKVSGGGAGGSGPPAGSAGKPGTAGTGGTGGDGDLAPGQPSTGGGGGGGGYYGGGGGGGGAQGNGNSGGGGGGASFTAKHASHVSAPAPTTSSAMVKITYKSQPKPVAITHRATGVKSKSASVHGSVNPEGLKTTYYFQYGTTAKYGQKSAKGSLSASLKASGVSAMLTGLRPATTYHFRVVATNASGTAEGRDLTFRTPSVAPAFTG